MKTLFRSLLALSLLTPVVGYSDSIETDIGNYSIINDASSFTSTVSASGAAYGSGLYMYGGARLEHSNQVLSPENTRSVSFSYSGNGPGTLDPTGRHLVMGVQDMLAGVTLQRKVFVPTNNSFIRWVNKVVNTSDEDVEVALIIEGLLDGESDLVYSSTEDDSFDLDDDWVITHHYADLPDETRLLLSDKTLVHIINGSGDGPELEETFFEDGEMGWVYLFELPAGETAVIMHFVSDVTEIGDEGQIVDFADALAEGDVPSALNFMTQAEYSQLLSEYAATIGLGDSGSSSGGCFIATAAFGTPMAQEIDTLRNVRDSYMLNNAVGAAFVDTYYRLSPAIADKVAAHPTLAAAVRIVLMPVVMIGNIILSSPMVLVSTLMVGAGLLIARRRRKSFSA